MKNLKLPISCLGILFVTLLFAGTSLAQIGYALTAFDWDEGLGTSETYLDYNAAYYYPAVGVDGQLIRYHDLSLTTFDLIESHSVDHRFDAVVLTHVNVQPGEIYAVFSDHWLETFYVGNGSYYDPFGLSYGFAGNGGNPYYGLIQGPVTYVYLEWLYLGRTGVIVAMPKIVQINPTAGLPDTNILIDIQGKYIGEHTLVPPVVTVDGHGVTAQFQNFLPDGVEFVFQIAPDADIGNHNVSLKSDGVPSNSVVFRVGDNSPVISSMTPPEGNTGETVSVTISGSHFGVNPQLQIDGAGINPTTLTATDSEIDAEFSIADATYIGNRNVTIKSNGHSGGGFVPGPGNSDTSNSAAFEVFKPLVTITPFSFLESNGKRDVTITISGAKEGSTFRAYMTQGQMSGGVVFDENNQAGIDLIGGNGVKIKKIKSLGYTSQSLDDWTFTVDGSGAQPKTQPFTVSSVQFEKEADCTGFDNVETPNPYLIVPQNGTNRVKAKITPDGASGNFVLSGVEQNGITVSPGTLSSGEQLLTLTAGNSTGEFSLQALGTEATDPASILKASVKKRIDKTVVIHSVTEENDDVQRLSPDKDQLQGEPNTIAIRPLNKTLQSKPQGDDAQVVISGIGLKTIYGISTGKDGVRDTPVSGDDVEVIDMVGHGTPNSMCVLAGSNHFRDTVKDPNNDDQVATDPNTGNEYINSGADGICQTRANGATVPPNENDIPTAQSLQDYLNNVAWGRQANVFFTVTRDTQARSVNYDLNRDNLFDTQAGPEPLAILNSEAYDSSKDFNLFYLGLNFLPIPGLGTPGAISNASVKSSYFSPRHNGSLEYVAAHEIGHLIENDPHHSNLIEDLMYADDLTSSPCRIRKRDWDLIGIANP